MPQRARFQVLEGCGCTESLGATCRPAKVLDLVARLRAGDPLGVPDIVRSALLCMAAQLDSLVLGICALERQLLA